MVFILIMGNLSLRDGMIIGIFFIEMILIVIFNLINVFRILELVIFCKLKGDFLFLEGC